MPVEESGNLLILMAAVAEMEGNADFADRYWPQLEQVGRIPEAERLRSGEPALHRRLRRPPGAQRQPVAPRRSAAWVRLPSCASMRGEDGQGEGVSRARRRVSPSAGWKRPTTAITSAWPSTSRARGARNTIWCGTGSSGWTCFAEIARKEMEYYRKMQNQFGLPLDSRRLHQARLGALDGDAHRRPGGFPPLVHPVSRFSTHARPFADDRLVFHGHRQETGLHRRDRWSAAYS